MNACALAGGTGGAKLLIGFQSVLGDDATAIVNVGDDAEIYGVHVAPDVDMCTYWLAGIADRERGWGISGDTSEIVDALAKLGHETWFGLGDRDYATCLYRTLRMSEGATLSEVTEEIARALGATARIKPATDDRLRTLMHAVDGRTLEFQEYFVKERCGPEIASVSYAGAATAEPAPGVIDAIDAADVVVICPSNPVVSVGPILAIGPIRDALRRHENVVAVSPIIRGAALKGPADKLMRELGHEPAASAVAGIYRDICDVFVIDRTDPDELARVEDHGIRAVALDTIIADVDSSARLAKELLAL